MYHFLGTEYAQSLDNDMACKNVPDSGSLSGAKLHMFHFLLRDGLFLCGNMEGIDSGAMYCIVPIWNCRET